MDLDDRALSGIPWLLDGTASAIHQGSGYRLTASGISFTVWMLPGVDIPRAVKEEVVEDLAPSELAGA